MNTSLLHQKKPVTFLSRPANETDRFLDNMDNESLPELT
jgi:hypothetical protein